MNRPLRRFALPALAGIAVLSTAWQKTPQQAGQQVTVTGAVVDMACRFSKGDSGPTHVACAEMCAKAGVPFGILTGDGKLYIPAKHGESSNSALLEFVEAQVTASGTAFPAGGAYSLEMTKISKKS